MTLNPNADSIFGHPARILPPTLDVARLTALVEQRIYDPAVLTGRELFFFPAEISSDRLDFYFTRMAPTSLANYAADAAEGRSFQNSHKWNELGMGMTLTGDLQREGETQRVVSWIYTVSGMKLNAALATDDMIAGIRAGLIRDVSIGFYGGQHLCSICGRDMLWDWDCPHVPGLTYTNGEGGSSTLAFAWVENARLAEVSAVYDGATPGAGILKAQRAAEEGFLDERGRQQLEARYRIALPSKRLQVAGARGNKQGSEIPALPITKESTMFRDLVTWNGDAGTLARAQFETLLTTAEAADRMQADLTLLTEADKSGKEERAALASQLQTVTAERDALVEAGQRVAALEAQLQEVEAQRSALQATVAANSDLEVRLSTAQATIDQLRPAAADGEQYRTDLIAEALGEGVRALGEHFSEGTYAPLLQQASLDVIKRMRDDWRRQANLVFTAGRKTADENTPPAAGNTDDTASLRAFRA